MSDQPGSPREFDVTPVTIEEEMRRSYLDYAMSVIVARAIPDVRDGLKPVHRRILYAMKEGGYDSSKPTRKSSRIVGDVMGQYHPHGDSAIYEALVRMAQDFSMRLRLVEGQGNFGSMDGDPPAAMRYTEARLARAAESMLEDIDKETVDFVANYDETTTEPTVLAAKFPNLLVNGAGGIAVGMATNIPTHNLGEVVDATLAYLDDPAIGIDALTEIVPGPDFPTGGVIMGRAGIRAAYHTGRGSITLRGKAEFEEIRKDRQAIVVTEIPYQVNKARMVERIADLVHDKQIEGIAELRDESDRHGVRVVVELKRDAVPDVVLNQLYRFTPLQSSFGVNMLALNRGRPELMNLKQVIEAFCRFREEVITRRTIYELGQARERAHTLVGLAIAVANLDAMIRLIREAKDPSEAREAMLARSWPAADVAPLIEMIDEPGRGVEDDGYRLSEAQAKAILELRLHRLTGLEREKINNDLHQLVERIAEYLAILSDRAKVIDIVRAELVEMKEAFGDARRTAIEDAEFEHDLEDLIQREDMVVTFTHGGYIKRVPLSTYRAQRRGGRGRAGMTTKEEDFVSQVFVLNTHTPVLFFSSRGMVYRLKVYKLPLGTPQARGKAMVNLLPLEQGETITTVLPLPEDEASWGDLYAMFATAAGNVRRNRLSDFTNVYANGKIAMKLEQGDRLISVQTCTEAHDVLLATRKGKAIRFRVDDVRVFAGRTSVGVRGISLAERDEVISMSVLRHADVSVEERSSYLRAANALRRAGDEEVDEPDLEGGETPIGEQRFAELQAAEEFVLSIAEDGFGKRTSAYEYRVTGRGGKGIDNLDLRRGRSQANVAAVFPVRDTDEIMLVSDGGQLIRMPVNGIRIAGRATRGVTLFRLADDERIVSVARLGDTGGGDEEGDIDNTDAPGDDA